ncbi:MAG: tripartite tricarboxylate transporter substrate-binding protein, partial [Xanthobacteraceae bacterium]
MPAGNDDLVAGHMHLGSINWTAARGQMRGGTIIPLAVPAGRRTPVMSDVPTLHELGFPALVGTPWFASAAPAGLPRDITARVTQEIAPA